MDLDELKINAYYDVLKAFMAESSTISSVSTGLNLFHVFVVSVLDGCAHVVFSAKDYDHERTQERIEDRPHNSHRFAGGNQE